MLAVPLQPLLAAPPPLWLAFTLMAIAAVVVGLAFCIAFMGILYGVRGYEWMAKRLLTNAYRGLKIHNPPETGDVVMSYETYHGIIAWLTHTQHIVAAPPEDARILLGRLLRFNLCFGFLAHAGVLIVPLAIFNYLGQRRSINRQETECHLACLQSAVVPPSTETLAELQRQHARPSALLQLVGYGAAVMAPVWVLQAIVGICRLDFPLAAGAIILFAGSIFVAEGFTEPRVFSTLLQKCKAWRAHCSVCGERSATVGPLQRTAENHLVCESCLGKMTRASETQAGEGGLKGFFEGS